MHPVEENYFATSQCLILTHSKNLRQTHLTIWLFYLFRIDMYSEGVADLGEMIMHFPLCPPAEKDAKLTLIREKTTNRYLPAFENVSGLFSIFGSEVRGRRKIVPGMAGAFTFSSVSLSKY